MYYNRQTQKKATKRNLFTGPGAVFTDKKMSEGTESIEKRLAGAALHSDRKGDVLGHDAAKKLEFIRDDSPVNRTMSSLQRIRESVQTNSELKRKSL